jgi:hypothetical protein
MNFFVSLAIRLQKGIYRLSLCTTDFFIDLKKKNWYIEIPIKVETFVVSARPEAAVINN